jgi:tRNA pseudouridine55 synthase
VNGILLVDKPSGWTSFDVVNYVRKMARQAALVESYKVASEKSAEPLNFKNFQLSTRSPKVKVGHTGTLDPLATGLLVLLLGDYTKRAAGLTKLDKTYEVMMKLGQTSTTGDEEGAKTPFPGPGPGRGPTRGLVERALRKFTGEIMQTPPAYSAVKIGGQRAYKLARAGKTVEIEPRRVTIYSTELKAYKYPVVEFTAKVSSGTYIRVLAEDVGKALQTGAYMSGLRRTEVGKFRLQDALAVEKLSPEVIASGISK